MNKSIKNILSQLLTISRRLAESAANGTWDHVAELEQEQRELLAYFFSRKGDQPLTAEALAGLAQVRLYTDMVVMLAKKKRKILGGAADRIQVGKKAVSAYAECV
ncbi:MAG: hypothetical protein AB8G18_06690 [Gammaproteobacteria bacterium]